MNDRRAALTVNQLTGELILREGYGTSLAFRAIVEIAPGSSAEGANSEDPNTRSQVTGVLCAAPGSSWSTARVVPVSDLIEESPAGEHERVLTIEGEIRLGGSQPVPAEIYLRFQMLDGEIANRSIGFTEPLRAREIPKDLSMLEDVSETSGGRAAVWDRRSAAWRAEVLRRTPCWLKTHGATAPEVTIVLVGDDVSAVASTLFALRTFDLGRVDVLIEDRPLLKLQDQFSGCRQYQRPFCTDLAAVGALAPHWSAPWWSALLEAVRSDSIIFLPAGAEPLPGSIEAFVAAAEDPEIGLVIGRAVGEDGYWEGESAAGRALSLRSSRSLFRRDVENAWTEWSLCRRRHIREALHGSWTRLGVEELGQWERRHGRRIRYEPAATLLISNDDRTARWGSASERGPGCPRLLVIDEPESLHPSPCGTSRIREIVDGARAEGFEVCVFPPQRSAARLAQNLHSVPIGIEVLYGESLETFATFLTHRGKEFSHLWVVRPGVMEAFGPLIEAFRRVNTGIRVVFDLGGLPSIREVLRDQVRGVRSIIPENVERLINRDVLPGRWADEIVVQSEAEGEEFRVREIGPVTVLGAVCDPTDHPDGAVGPLPCGLCTLGEAQTDETPHGDGLMWFLSLIAPRLSASLAPEQRHLRCLGTYGQWFRRLAPRYPVSIEDFAGDRAAVLRRSQVFIAPIRFDSGVPVSVLSAAAAAMPIVCTGVVASQFGWEHGREAYVANNPDEFANGVGEVLTTPALAARLGSGALEFVRRNAARGTFRETLREILARAPGRGPTRAEMSSDILGGPSRSVTSPTEQPMQSRALFQTP